MFAKIKKQLHIKYLPRAERVTAWSVWCPPPFILLSGPILFILWTLLGLNSLDSPRRLRVGGQTQSVISFRTNRTGDQMMLLTGRQDTCKATSPGRSVHILLLTQSRSVFWGLVRLVQSLLCGVCSALALRSLINATLWYFQACLRVECDTVFVRPLKILYSPVLHIPLSSQIFPFTVLLWLGLSSARMWQPTSTAG